MINIAEKPDDLAMGPDEKIMWTGNRSKRSFITSKGKGVRIFFGLGVAMVFLAGIVALESAYSIGETCTLFLFIFFGLMAILPFTFQNKYQYAITNKRVFSKKGFSDRKINEIPLEKVVNTTYSKSFMGSLLGFGDLQFNSAAGADHGVVFQGIKNVKGINQRFKQIKAAMEDEDRNLNKFYQRVNVKSDSYISSPNMAREVSSPEEARPDMPKLKRKERSALKEKNKPVLKKSESEEEGTEETQKKEDSLKETDELENRVDQLEEKINSLEKSSEEGLEDREINYCKKCGYEIDEETVYCERCGYRIRDQSEQ